MKRTLCVLILLSFSSACIHYGETWREEKDGRTYSCQRIVKTDEHNPAKRVYVHCTEFKFGEVE